MWSMCRPAPLKLQTDVPVGSPGISRDIQQASQGQTVNYRMYYLLLKPAPQKILQKRPQWSKNIYWIFDRFTIANEFKVKK